MGRFIDPNKPLTDEDRQYLNERSRNDEVIVNDRQFGHLNEDDKQGERDEYDASEKVEQEERKRFQDAMDDENANSYPWELVDKVDPLTENQLKVALKKRNLEVGGTKSEMQVRLVVFLEEQEIQKEAEAEAAAVR